MKKWLLLLLFCSSALFANEPTSPLIAELYSDHQTITPGQEFSLILDVKLEHDWHFYWKNPGEAGMAPSLEWELPEGVSIVKTEWPTPERFEKEGMITFGYSSQVPFLITAKLKPSTPLGDFEIKGNLGWVICSSETCLPGSSEVSAKVHVASESKKDEQKQGRFTEVKQALPKSLPLSSITKGKDTVTVSVDDEIAMADTPLFFPESGSDFNIIPKISRRTKGADIQLSSGAGKGILVLGNKAWSVDEVEESSSENLLTFGGALLFAFLGGLILNLMPCVLPVVSLKVMSFAKMAGQSRAELTKHGVAFTFGVLISFWALAGAIILLQSTGEAVGWGFQLQDPLFIALLALLFVLLGLSLFGVFELGTGIATMAGEASLKEKKGYQASFFSGIFATAVATPCTGPFMGSALGYALTQPAYITMTIFTALALGMSLPYLLLGIFPSLIRWFPKPGAWMETFKQFLGFLMMLTVLWLLWVFVGQTSEFALFGLLFALLIASLGAWIFGRFGAPYRSKNTRIVGYVLATLCLVFALGTVNFSSRLEASNVSSVPSDWEPYSEARVAELRSQGIPVLIDFTAKWCLICQTNHMVLTGNKVEKTLNERRVVKMKADWTKRDPEITKALRNFGRSGVPLYVFYGEDKEPQILPQVLVPDSVISLVESKTGDNVR